jgi:N-acetylmuramoyl-L-alanine amidase
MARSAKADLFISIHADAFRRRSAKGFSVFALSQRGATSAMASALAAKENASDLIGGVSLSDKDDLLAKVLVDLSMTNTISESVNLGGRVLQELGEIGSLHSKKVEQAGFAVLKSADIPSILVETGFITNPTEERNLKSSRYQQKLATAIYTAINKYLQQTPYRSTASFANPRQVALSNSVSTYNSLVRPSFHKVVRGDSLSKIADRYGISVVVLKRLNGLKSDTAVLGQRLKLPNGSSASPRFAKIGSARPSVHVVRRGDSLSKISARYNITMHSLRRLNNLSKDTVYVGQKIEIPGGTSKAVVVQKPRKHKVRSGDTLSDIAEKYNSTVSRIMQVNALKSRTIFLGQTLRIP